MENKLESQFGITGGLLDWIKSYLSGRTQYTVLNGVTSELLPVKTGIPQGSVLGPTLFTLFCNDLPSAVGSGTLYMYADDTTIFCIGESADIALIQLNKALKEVYKWCLENRLTPHPGKSEIMILSKKSIMGPLPPVYLGQSVLRYVSKTRLLGMTVDNKLTWVPHVMELKKSFVNKLELLKRSRFLPTDVLLKFYFSVILPSIKYGLILWGSCCNSNLINSIERLHCRAARIVFNLPKDMPSVDVLKINKWRTLKLDYKLEVFKLFYKANNGVLPKSLASSIFIKRSSKYSLRGQNVVSIPIFKSRLMKDSLAHRGSVLWNLVNYNESLIDLSFKAIKTLLTVKEYFIDFTFECSTASTSQFRERNYMYF